MQKIRNDLNSNKNNIDRNNALHSDYKHEETITRLMGYMEKGRARDKREAINLLHTEKARERSESTERMRLEEQIATRMIADKDAKRNENYRQQMLDEKRRENDILDNIDGNVEEIKTLKYFDMMLRR